ncbi:MAG TPA: hypothetical protein VFC45_10670 [Pseudolabrys sp.]|nr:hypothetical protein [Pseudolabrys sp.]
MRIMAVMIFAAAAAMPIAAEAASVGELFQQFKLFGTWAPDCGQPASPANVRVTITTPSAGQVLEDHDLGSGFAVNRYSMLSAERLSDERLSVETILQPGNDAEDHERLIFLVRGPTRRTMFNQPDGGAVRVKGGIALPGGSKTPVLRKCE